MKNIIQIIIDKIIIAFLAIFALAYIFTTALLRKEKITMKKFNLRKKILALTLTAITMFSTIAGLLPGGIVHAADATSGMYYGIHWNMDAEGNLVLHEGTTNTIRGSQWNYNYVTTVTIDGPIIASNDFCESLFIYCKNLTTINNISNLDTTNATDMDNMFQNCSNLTSLDLSSFNTSKVTSMNQMFVGCSNLKELDLSSFNTNSVTDMRSMFNGCSSLESLDLSSFNTSNVTNTQYMFSGCSALKSLDLSSFEINTSVTSSMFSGVTHLEYLKTPKTVVSSISFNKDFTPIIMCDDNENQYAELNSGNTNMTLYLCFNGYLYDVPYTYYKNTETVVLHEGEAKNTSSPGNWFPKTTETVKTDGHVVMNNAFRRAFSNLHNAESIDLSNVDTSNVTNMSDMFYCCEKLRSLNISNLDTSKVTQMQSMFDGCSSLESLDLSNFNTSNATNMRYMFNGCSSLKTLDLSNFNTSNVTNMQYMFNGCSSLKTLDLSNFDMKKVTWPSYVYGMFSGLDSLQVLKTPKAMDHNPELTQNAQFDYPMHDIVNDVYYENLSVENTTLYNETNCPKTTVTDYLDASYDENNNLVVKAHQVTTCIYGSSEKTVDIDTYGVTDQGTTLLITYDGASTEIEKIVNIEGTLLYNDGTPVQQKVVKLSTPKDMFDLSSEEGHYEFLNVPLANNVMPLSVFDTDDTSACSDDILLTSSVVTFDNTGLPLLDNNPSKEMTLVIEKVTSTVPEREEVVVPTPEVVPAPKPSTTTTVVVPEPIADNINSVGNTNTESTPIIETSVPAEKIVNTPEESTKPEIKNAASKNDTISEKPEQNNEKLTNFSKNSEKDNPAVKDDTEDKIEQSSLSENKDTESINNILIIIACILIVLFFAWLIHSLRKNARL